MLARHHSALLAARPSRAVLCDSALRSILLLLLLAKGAVE